MGKDICSFWPVHLLRGWGLAGEDWTLREKMVSEFAGQLLETEEGSGSSKAWRCSSTLLDKQAIALVWVQ